jgi:hypothetical protein
MWQELFRLRVPVRTETNMTSDEEEIKRPTGWDAVGRGYLPLCVLPGLATMLAVAHFADLGRVRAAGICTLVDILVIKLRW